MIKMMNASNISDFNATNDSTILSNEELLELKLGPRFQDTWSVVILLTIYGLIFISGTVGNVCTCIVIVRNNYMQTATNYYLFSLAISDVFTLLLALPPEAYSIWEAYPWRFGEVFCYIKALLQEMTSYASVLTIVAFTVERYAAICYPLQAHKFANLSRCIAIIIAIWIISLLCALPYPLHTDTFYYVNNTNGTKIPESLICNMPLEYRSTMIYVFQFSTFAFFVFPMTIIAVLYLLIAIALRKAALQRASSQEAKCQVGTPVSQSGKSVFRMLVAVVVAFFISWAPFHAQRLLTIYIGEWTPLLLDIQSGLFYISGMLYFVGSTVNPILYNVMSKRYREAFRETICHCRKRASNYRNGSGIHQSYYSHKSIRTTPRTAQTRPDNSRAKNVQRSDTVQTQVNISLNGNSDGLCDSHRELLLRDRKQGVPYDSKYWSENSDKSSCCQVCVSEQREIISSPCYERQGLLCNVKSEDSAC